MKHLLCFFFFLSPLFSENLSIRHTYLTWQNDTSHTMTINVHTLNNLDELTVHYDESNRDTYRFSTTAKGIPFLKGSEKRWIFHIELTDLKPGTTYQFIVGNENTGFTERKKFRTIPQNSSSYRFISGGDWEVTPTAHELAKQAASCDPMAIFLGGDYPRKVESLSDYKKWDEWLDCYASTMITIDECMIPMVLAIGNHDVFGWFNQTPEQAPFYYTYFKQNQRNKSYFSRCFGKDIVLFVLDSGHTATYDGDQLDWLEKELKRYREKRVKLAIYHVPIYPSIRFSKSSISYHLISAFMHFNGKGALTGALLSPQSAKGKKYWAPLFDECSLTAAFEHHDQTLKRTKLLRSGKPHPSGTLFLGDGGWGPLVRVAPIQNFFHSIFAKTVGHVSFFWLFDISEDKIRYRAVTEKGQVIDEYTQILKDIKCQRG